MVSGPTSRAVGCSKEEEAAAADGEIEVLICCQIPHNLDRSLESLHGRCISASPI